MTKLEEVALLNKISYFRKPRSQDKACSKLILLIIVLIGRLDHGGWEAGEFES